jgi:hypothetical protein
MECHECGRYVGHATWCSNYFIKQNSSLIDNPLKDGIRPISTLENDYDYLDNLLKPSRFKPITVPSTKPYEPYEPLIPEIKPIKPFEEDRPSYLESVLEPRKPFIDPLSRQEPLFKTPETRLPELVTDKPPFLTPPASPTGIIRNYHAGIDTGIRFTDGGIIKNDLGYNLGKVDGNLIYNDSGHLMGKVAHDGRIMDLNGHFTGDFIDKDKF